MYKAISVRGSLGALTSALFVVGLTSFAAFAQDDATRGNNAAMLEEIVVIGRGREENIQEIPLSETVFTAQTIEDARIDQVDDFLALTPGVTFANSTDAGTNFITIRGVSQTRNGEPPVAVVVDGVLQVNGRAFDQPLFDLDSVEVLRGPQGALYGRNATGGAIIINTGAPTNDFEGYVQGTYGEGDEYQFEGSVSGPLIEDRLLFRLSTRYLDRKGYLDNLTRNETVDFLEDITLRGHLNYRVSEQVSADLRVSITRTDGHAVNFSYQPATYDPATGLNTAFDFSRNDADAVARDFFANNRSVDERDITQVSLRINADLDFATLRLVSAYDRIEESLASDQAPYSGSTTLNTVAAGWDGTQSQFFDIETFSQEVRLTSRDDQPLRWMAGAYFLTTDRFANSSVMQDLGQGIVRRYRTPLTDPSNPLSSFIADANDNTAWALFFNVAYDLTDAFEIAFAGRYDKDKREQQVDPRQGSYADGVVTGPIGSPGAVNKAKFDLFQPKVSLRYLVTADVNLYASWGTGFRSGQFNQNGVGAVAAAAGVSGVSDLLSQEETSTFEAGIKTAWFGNRLTLNGSVYRTEIENAPFFVFIPAVSAQVLVPIDEIEVLGGELELAASLSAGLDAYLGIGIADSEVKEYAVDPAAVGNKGPYVANSTVNAGIQYRLPVTENVGLFGRVDYERRGRQFWDPQNSTARAALNLLNLRAGIEGLGGDWSLTASLDNATDEIYNSEFVVAGFAHAGVPRVWRVDLRVNF